MRFTNQFAILLATLALVNHYMINSKVGNTWVKGQLKSTVLSGLLVWNLKADSKRFVKTEIGNSHLFVVYESYMVH